MPVSNVLATSVLYDKLIQIITLDNPTITGPPMEIPTTCLKLRWSTATRFNPRLRSNPRLGRGKQQQVVVGLQL